MFPVVEWFFRPRHTNAHFMVNDFFARILVGVYIVKFGVPGMQQEFAID